LSFAPSPAVAGTGIPATKPVEENTVIRSVLTGVFVAVLSFTPAAQACTGIRLIARDGGVVASRTLEFGFDMHSEVLVMPAGTALTGTLPDGGKGISYTTKYGFLGANAEGRTAIVDGINERAPLAQWRLTNMPIGCWAISRLSMR
jgi:penicillin V acylase-like amidase (Ntn superfamily)